MIGTDGKELTETLVRDSGGRFTVQLDRGKQGSYGWSISVTGDSMESVCDLVQATDMRLRSDYLVVIPDNEAIALSSAKPVIKQSKEELKW